MQRVGDSQLEEAVLVLASETAAVVDARDDRLSPRLVCCSSMIACTKSASSWLRISQKLSVAGVIA
jgi:hypothetical protein